MTETPKAVKGAARGAQHGERSARAAAGLGGRSHLLQRPALQSRPPTARLTSSWPPLLAAASCVAGAGGSANTTFCRSSTPASPCARGSRVFLRPCVASCDRALSSLWGRAKPYSHYIVHVVIPPKHRPSWLTQGAVCHQRRPALAR